MKNPSCDFYDFTIYDFCREHYESHASDHIMYARSVGLPDPCIIESPNLGSTCYVFSKVAEFPRAVDLRCKTVFSCARVMCQSQVEPMVWPKSSSASSVAKVKLSQ